MKIHKIKNILPNQVYLILKKIYHIFRFFNLVKIKYSSSKNIYFGSNKAANFLKKKILNSKLFLEFGSGNTTIFAMENGINCFTIESDRNFYFYLKKIVKKKIFFYSLGFVEFYSYPLFRSNFFKQFYKKRALTYSSKIFKKFDNENTLPDLILVDGRYRVLCMLNIFIFLKKNDLDKTCVVLDDYKSRSYYNIINQFFDVEIIGRLGVCVIKKNISIDEDLIKKIDYYALDPR